MMEPFIRSVTGVPVVAARNHSVATNGESANVGATRTGIVIFCTKQGKLKNEMEQCERR